MFLTRILAFIDTVNVIRQLGMRFLSVHDFSPSFRATNAAGSRSSFVCSASLQRAFGFTSYLHRLQGVY